MEGRGSTTRSPPQLGPPWAAGKTEAMAGQGRGCHEAGLELEPSQGAWAFRLGQKSVALRKTNWRESKIGFTLEYIKFGDWE